MFDDGAFEIPDSFDADDIDIFAELGVSGNNQITSASDVKKQQNENLAILLADEEKTIQTTHDNTVDLVNESGGFSLPDETISELLEILVFDTVPYLHILKKVYGIRDILVSE